MYRIDGWEPEATSSSTPIESLGYDIFNYLGIPSNTIQAIINGLNIQVAVSGDTRSKTITFNGGLGSSVELNSSTSYTNA
jgi:hypothetical protein